MCWHSAQCTQNNTTCTQRTVQLHKRAADQAKGLWSLESIFDPMLTRSGGGPEWVTMDPIDNGLTALVFTPGWSSITCVRTSGRPSVVPQRRVFNTSCGLRHNAPKMGQESFVCVSQVGQSPMEKTGF